MIEMFLPIFIGIISFFLTAYLIFKFYNKFDNFLYRLGKKFEI